MFRYVRRLQPQVASRGNCQLAHPIPGVYIDALKVCGARVTHAASSAEGYLPMLMTWVGFIVSLAVLLTVSKKNMPVALIFGALVLGFFTLPISVLLDRVVYTVTDLNIVFLALAMGVIPIIGGTMKESGQIDSMVNNVRISRRYLLAFSAAFMGLLPMPGGALLSAPILEKGGEGVPDHLKASINNWFRHLFILIYPLSPALIASAKIAGLDVYHAMLYLLPGLAFATALGYGFFLHQVRGRPRYSDDFSWTGLVMPLLVILSAPILDFILKRLADIGSLATIIGVTTALMLSIAFSRKRPAIGHIVIGMKPWNFALIIIGMFLYLHVFQQSNARILIATLPLPPLTLAVTAGFLLGLMTGRVQLPASIILPVYLAAAGSISPATFALVYTAIFFGYIISPVHPCLVVTSEYFRTPVRELMIRLAPATAIVFGVTLLISILSI